MNDLKYISQVMSKNNTKSKLHLVVTQFSSEMTLSLTLVAYLACTWPRLTNLGVPEWHACQRLVPSELPGSDISINPVHHIEIHGTCLNWCCTLNMRRHYNLQLFTLQLYAWMSLLHMRDSHWICLYHVALCQSNHADQFVKTLTAGTWNIYYLIVI